MENPQHITIDLNQSEHWKQVCSLQGPNADTVPVTVIPKNCPFCFEPHPDFYTLSGNIISWLRDGHLIQDVFPEISVDMREILITGIHPECWNTELGEDEDYE